MSSGAMPRGPGQPGYPEEPKQLEQPTEPEQLEQGRDPEQLERPEGLKELEQPRQPKQLQRPGRPGQPRQRGRPRQPEDPGQAGRSENPTDSANLTVSSIPVSINMSARGTLALGVVGPAGTIAVAHLVGFPVGATLVICILQIVAAVVNHNWRH